MTHNFEPKSTCVSVVNTIHRQALADRSNRFSLRPRVNYGAITHSTLNENCLNEVIGGRNGYAPKIAELRNKYETNRRIINQPQGLNGNDICPSKVSTEQSKSNYRPTERNQSEDLSIYGKIGRSSSNTINRKGRKIIPRGYELRSTSNRKVSKEDKTKSVLQNSNGSPTSCVMTSWTGTSSKYVDVHKDTNINNAKRTGTTCNKKNLVIKPDSDRPERDGHHMNNSDRTKVIISAVGKTVSAATSKLKSATQKVIGANDSDRIVASKIKECAKDSMCKTNESSSAKTNTAGKCRSLGNSIKVFVDKESVTQRMIAEEQADARCMKRSISADNCNRKSVDRDPSAQINVRHTLPSSNMLSPRGDAKDASSLCSKPQNERRVSYVNDFTHGSTYGNNVKNSVTNVLDSAKSEERVITTEKSKIKRSGDLPRHKTKDINVCVNHDKQKDNIPMLPHSSDTRKGISSTSKHVLRDKYIKTDTCNRYITKKSPGERASDNVEKKTACLKTSKIPRNEAKLHRQDVANVNTDGKTTDTVQVSTAEVISPVRANNNNSSSAQHQTEANGQVTTLSARDVTTRGHCYVKPSQSDDNRVNETTPIRDSDKVGLISGLPYHSEDRIGSYVYWNTGLVSHTFQSQLSEDKSNSEDVIISCEQYENDINDHTISSGFIDSTHLNRKLVCAKGSANGKPTTSNDFQHSKTCYCLSYDVVLKDTNLSIVSEHSKAELDTSPVCLCRLQKQSEGTLICQEKNQVEQYTTRQSIQNEKDKYCIKRAYHRVLDRAIRTSGKSDNPVFIERSTTNNENTKSAQSECTGNDLGRNDIHCEMNKSTSEISSKSQLLLCNGSSPRFDVNTGRTTSNDLTPAAFTGVPSVEKVNKCSKSSVFKQTAKSVTDSQQDNENRIRSSDDGTDLKEITLFVGNSSALPPLEISQTEKSKIKDVESKGKEIITDSANYCNDDIQSRDQLGEEEIVSLCTYQSTLSNSQRFPGGVTHINDNRQGTSGCIIEGKETCSTVSVSSENPTPKTQNSLNLNETNKDGNSITAEKSSNPGKGALINELYQDLDRSVKVSGCRESCREIISNAGTGSNIVRKSKAFENYSAVDCYRSDDAHANSNEIKLPNKGDENINYCRKRTENCALVGDNGQSFTSKVAIDSGDQSTSILEDSDGNAGSRSIQMTKHPDGVKCLTDHDVLCIPDSEEERNDYIANNDSQSSVINTQYSQRLDCNQTMKMDNNLKVNSGEYESVFCNQEKVSSDTTVRTPVMCNREDTIRYNASINITNGADKSGTVLDSVGNYPNIGLQDAGTSSKNGEYRTDSPVSQIKIDLHENQRTDSDKKVIKSDCKNKGTGNKSGIKHTDGMKVNATKELTSNVSDAKRIPTKPDLQNTGAHNVSVTGQDKIRTSKISSLRGSTLKQPSASKLAISTAGLAIKKIQSKVPNVSNVKSENATKLRGSKSNTPSPNMARKLSDEKTATSRFGKAKYLVKLKDAPTNIPSISKSTHGDSEKKLGGAILSEKCQRNVHKPKQSPLAGRKTEKSVAYKGPTRTIENKRLSQDNSVKTKDGSKFGELSRCNSSQLNQKIAGKLKTGRISNSSKPKSTSSSPASGSDRASKSPSPSRTSLRQSGSIGKPSTLISSTRPTGTKIVSIPRQGSHRISEKEVQAKKESKIPCNRSDNGGKLGSSDSKLPTVRKKEKTPPLIKSHLSKSGIAATQEKLKNSTEDSKELNKMSSVSKSGPDPVKRPDRQKLSNTSSLAPGTQKQKCQTFYRIGNTNESKPVGQIKNTKSPKSSAPSSPATMPRSRSTMPCDTRLSRKPIESSESSPATSNSGSPCMSRRNKMSSGTLLTNSPKMITKRLGNSKQGSNLSATTTKKSKIPNRSTLSKKSAASEISTLPATSRGVSAQKTCDKSPVLQKKPGLVMGSKLTIKSGKPETIKTSIGESNGGKLSNTDPHAATAKKELTNKTALKQKSIPRTSTPITRIYKTQEKQNLQKPGKLVINSSESARTTKIGIPAENITAVRNKSFSEIYQNEKDGDKISEINSTKIPALSTELSSNADVDKGDSNAFNSNFFSLVQSENEQSDANGSDSRCVVSITMEVSDMHLTQTKEHEKSDESHSPSEAPDTKNINKTCEQNHVTATSDQHERNYVGEMVQTADQAIINDSDTDSEEYWSLSDDDSCNSNSVLKNLEHNTAFRDTYCSDEDIAGQGNSLKHKSSLSKNKTMIGHSDAHGCKDKAEAEGVISVINKLVPEKQRHTSEQWDYTMQVADDGTEDAWCEAADDNIKNEVIEGGVLFSDNKSCNKKPFDLRSKNITHPPKFDSESEVLNVNSTKLYEKDKKHYVSEDIGGKLPVLANLEEYADEGQDKSEIQINEGSEGVSDSNLVKNFFDMENSGDRMPYLLSSYHQEDFSSDTDVLPQNKVSSGIMPLKDEHTTEGQDFNRDTKHDSEFPGSKNTRLCSEGNLGASKTEHSEEELNGISDKASGTLCRSDLANDPSLSEKHNITETTDLNHFESGIKHARLEDSDGSCSAEIFNSEYAHGPYCLENSYSDECFSVKKEADDENITSLTCAKENKDMMDRDVPTDTSNVTRSRKIVTRSQRSIKYETVTTRIVRHDRTDGDFATLETCSVENKFLPSDLVNKQSHILQSSSSSSVTSRIVDKEDDAKSPDHLKCLSASASSEDSLSREEDVLKTGNNILSGKEIDLSNEPYTSETHPKSNIHTNAENNCNTRKLSDHHDSIPRELSKDDNRTSSRSKVSIIKSTSNRTETINVTVRSRNSSQIDSQCSSVKFSKVNSQTIQFDGDSHGLHYQNSEGISNTYVTSNGTRYDDSKVSSVSICDKDRDSRISLYSGNNSETQITKENRSLCNLEGITDLAVASNLTDIKSAEEINENVDNSTDLRSSITEISLGTSNNEVVNGKKFHNKFDDDKTALEEAVENLDEGSLKTDADNLTNVKIKDTSQLSNKSKLADEIKDSDKSNTEDPQKSIQAQTLQPLTVTSTSETKTSLLHNSLEEHLGNNGKKELTSKELKEISNECRLSETDSSGPDVQVNSMPRPVIQIIESKLEGSEKTLTNESEMQEPTVNSNQAKSKRKERSRQELRRFTATVCLIEKNDDDKDSVSPPQRPRARSKSPITLKTEITGVESKQSVTCMGNGRVSEICRTFIRKADKVKGAELPLDKSRPTSPTIQSPAPGRKMKWVNNCGKWKRIPVEDGEGSPCSPEIISPSDIMQMKPFKSEKEIDQARDLRHRQDQNKTESISKSKENESHPATDLQTNQKNLTGNVTTVKPKSKEPPKVLPKPSEEVRRKNLANIVTKWTSLGQRKIVAKQDPCDITKVDRAINVSRATTASNSQKAADHSPMISDNKDNVSDNKDNVSDNKDSEQVHTSENFQYFKTLEIKEVHKPVQQKQRIPKMLLKQDDGWKTAVVSDEDINTNTLSDTTHAEMPLVSDQGMHDHTDSNQTDEQVHKNLNVLSEVLTDKPAKQDEMTTIDNQARIRSCGESVGRAGTVVTSESKIKLPGSDTSQPLPPCAQSDQEHNTETKSFNTNDLENGESSGVLWQVHVPENKNDRQTDVPDIDSDLHVEFNITLPDICQGMDTIQTTHYDTENNDKSAVDDDITPTNTPCQKPVSVSLTDSFEATPTNTPKLKAVKIKQEIFPREDTSSQDEKLSIQESTPTYRDISNVKFYINDDSGDEDSKDSDTKSSDSSLVKSARMLMKSEGKYDHTKDIRSFGYSSYLSRKRPEDYTFPKFSQYGRQGKSARVSQQNGATNSDGNVPEPRRWTSDSAVSQGQGVQEQKKLLSEIVELEESNRKGKPVTEVQRSESAITSAELESTTEISDVNTAYNRSKSLPTESLSVLGQNKIVYKDGHFVIETGLEGNDEETCRGEEENTKDELVENESQNKKHERKEKINNKCKWKSNSEANLCDNKASDEDVDIFLRNENDVTVIDNGNESPYWHVLVKRRSKGESEERKSQIPRPLSVDENQLQSLMTEAENEGKINKEKNRASMKRRSASFRELGTSRLKRNSSFKEAQEKGAIIGITQRSRNDSVGNLSLSPSEISTCSEMPSKSPGILKRMFRRNKSFSERGSNDSSKIKDIVKKKISIRNLFQGKKPKSEFSLERQLSESSVQPLAVFEQDMDIQSVDSAPNSPYSSQRFRRRYTSDDIFEQRASTLPRRPSDIRKPHPLHLSQDHLSVQSLNAQNLLDHPKRPISPKPTGVTIVRRNSNLSLPSSPIRESPYDTDGPFKSSSEFGSKRLDSSSGLDNVTEASISTTHGLECRSSKQSSTQDLEHYTQLVQGGEMTSSNSNDSGIQRDVSIHSSNESIKNTQDSSSTIVRRCKSPSPRPERPKSEISVRWADLVETTEVTPIKHREGSTRKQRPKSDLEENLRLFDELYEEMIQDCLSGGSSFEEDMKPFGSLHNMLPYSSLQSLDQLRKIEAMDQKPTKRRMSTPHPIKTRLERVPKKQKTRNPLIRSHSMPENLDKIYKRKRFLSSIGSSDLHSHFLRPFDDDSSSDEGSDISADQLSLHEKSLSARSSCNYLSTLEERPETDVLTYAEALWDHITMDPEELGFRAGDVIEVTDMTDKDWWWGAVDEQEGWFPATFVRLRVNQERVTDDSSYKPGDKCKESSPLVRRVSVINEEQARENVVNEIIHAERDYVKHLKDVVEGYIKHARKRTDMFSDDRISVIFGNMEDLYEFSKRFLEKVEKSFNEQNPPLSEIGHCFLDCCKEFEIYSDYCNNHPSACEELKDLYRKQKYRHFFEACRLLQEMIEIPLEGFLLTPVQKICKYPLQLAELLKYTPISHPDHSNVKGALEAMKKIAALINERKRKMESIEKLAQWQTSVEDWQGTDLLESSSELIYSGEVNKINSAGWSQERYFFLFDHQLVYCKKDLLKKNGFSYKGRVDLNDCEVIPVEDGKDTQYNVTVKNAWKLHEVTRDKWYLLYTKTTTEKQKWLKAFNDERRQVKEDQENNFVPVHWKKMVLNKIKSSHEKHGNRINMLASYQKDFIRGIPSHATLPRSYSKKVQKKKAWFIFGNKKTK